MTARVLPSGTVTFLFTDVEGSTALWERDRMAMAAAVDRHFFLLRTAIEAHGGVLYKTVGDAAQAAFSSALQAVAAALAAQRALLAEVWGDGGPLRVRMAVHAGEATPHGGDYLAPELNRLSRLLSTCHGGQVLLSAAARALVRDALPPDASLRDLGLHRLRDLASAERVFQLLHPELPVDFPALRSLDVRQHNLPSQPTPFLGREQAVSAVVGLLQREDARLVTLTGPGGVGKSRLAMRVATDLLDNFPDGVVFVPLSPISDPASVPSAVAQVLGLPEDGRQEPIDQLRDYLASKSLLLVLDSFEHLLDASPLLDSLLATCAGIKILVTSRHPTRLSWETEVEVAPMSSVEALALFEGRARAKREDFVLTDELRPIVAELCARLDGLPLAIELAAAHIKVLSPVAMLDRLGRRLDLLSSGPPNAPARHQTIRATIDWSHDLLSPTEQAVFRRLAVFPGEFGLEEAIAVGTLATPTDLSDPKLLASLEALIDSSLLRRSSGEWDARYSMLEIIRDYAQEQLANAGEAPRARLQLATGIADLAEQGVRDHRGIDALTFYDYLETERHNIRAAVNAAIEDRQSVLVARLVQGLWRYWMAKGHLTEGRQFAEAALNANASNASLGAELQMIAAGFAQEQGDAKRARALMQEVVSVTADKLERAELLRNLGLIQQSLGESKDAEISLQEALSLHQGLGNTEGIAYDLVTLGTFAGDADEHERSLRLFDEAQQLLQQLSDAGEQPDPLMGMAAISGMGRALHGLGDLISAAGAYESSYKLERNHSHKQGAAYALQGLAQVAFDLGRTDEALELLTLSVELWRDLSDKRRLAAALEDRRRFMADSRDRRGIVRYLCRAIQPLVEHGERRRLAVWAESLAALIATDIPELATRLLGAAVAIREEVGWLWLVEVQPYRERLGASLFASLGTSGYSAAFEDGLRLTSGDLIAIARAIEAKVGS